MTSIVFSRDRAMQLHAFLRSYVKYVTPIQQLSVLYLATNARHAQAYMDVFKGFPFVTPVAQQSFRTDLLAMLPSTGCVVFFVDDILFLRPWQVQETPNLSLRLGLNLTRNYASHDAPQPLPPYERTEEYITWRWVDGQIAWGYPLSVDGHIYDLAQLRPMIESISFHSPNTLESALQKFTYQFDRGYCYPLSKIVNVPWNLVQTDWSNRHADGITADNLLDCWESGQQIDLKLFEGVIPESVHQEFPLRLEPRC